MAGSKVGRGEARVRVWLRWMLLGAATGFVLAAQTAAQEGRAAGKELTSAGAVHALSQEQAGKGLPVHLRGVVTFYDVPTNSLFVSDATGGVYVWVPPKPVLPLKRGTLVDITGVSQPGDFAAIVSNRRLSVLGQSRQPTRAPRVSVGGNRGGDSVGFAGRSHGYAEDCNKRRIDARADAGKAARRLRAADGRQGSRARRGWNRVQPP